MITRHSFAEHMAECFAVSLLALLTACGCTNTQAEVGKSEPPAIPVSHPEKRQVTDYVDFTGQTQAVQAVTIVPRVTGFLIREPFTEGGEVKGPKGNDPGDLLFEIDPRPYQAQYDQAESQVTLNQARLKESQADNARAIALAKTPGAISKQDLDRYQAAEEEAEASLEAVKANLKIYKLNLDFCKIYSPIDGQVSRYFLAPQNLVNQDQTQLTTVVSLDPMQVYFEMDEVTLQVVRRARDEGRIKAFEKGQFPVEIGLQSETGYPHQGYVDFFNNTVTSATGSISVRGVIKNPAPKNGGHRLFSPGMFARVHLPIGQPHDALLVIDRAIGSDQGQKYVYTMDADHKIQQKAVQTGALEDDGMRVIETTGKKDDLKAEDWVIVGGILQVRPKMEINPDFEPMPTLGPSVGGDSSSSPSGSSKSSGADTGKAPSPADGSGKPPAAKQDSGTPGPEKNDAGKQDSGPEKTNR